MTWVIISNAILCAFVLVGIVGSHVWAIVTHARDHPVGPIATGPSSEVPRLSAVNEEDSQQGAEVAII